MQLTCLGCCIKMFSQGHQWCFCQKSSGKISVLTLLDILVVCDIVDLPRVTFGLSFPYIALLDFSASLLISLSFPLNVDVALFLPLDLLHQCVRHCLEPALFVILHSILANVIHSHGLNYQLYLVLEDLANKNLIYTKNIVSLKFKFHWSSYISFGNHNYTISHKF